MSKSEKITKVKDVMDDEINVVISESVDKKKMTLELQSKEPLNDDLLAGVLVQIIETLDPIGVITPENSRCH